jgi:hypothetical protein
LNLADSFASQQACNEPATSSQPCMNDEEELDEIEQLHASDNTIDMIIEERNQRKN